MVESMDNVLFHTFATQGYLHWAELYLESLRYVYGDNVHIRMDAINFDQDDIKMLKHIKSNLDIRNHIIDYKEEGKKLGIEHDVFQSWKNEVEKGCVTSNNYLFKIFISVNKRYRNMQFVIDEAKNKGFKYLLHSDIDAYFRKSLNGLFDIMYENDIGAYFRRSSKDTQKVLGAFLVFNLQRNCFPFINEWMHQIDSVPFQNRWRDFGQSVLWYAIINTKDKVSIVDLATQYKAPIYSQMFDTSAHIWFGSNSISLNKRETPLNKSWKDLKTGLPRIRLSQKNKISQNYFLMYVYHFFDFMYMCLRKLKRKLQYRW